MRKVLEKKANKVFDDAGIEAVFDELPAAKITDKVSVLQNAEVKRKRVGGNAKPFGQFAGGARSTPEGRKDLPTCFVGKRLE